MIFRLSKHLSDEAIIEGILMGGRKEHEALIALYNKFHVSLERFITHRSSGRDYAKQPEDIIWETIEAFVVNIKKGSYTSTEASLETYLKSICKNLWFRYISSESSRDERQNKYMSDWDELDDNVSNTLIDQQNWEYYINLVSKAGKNCRQILDMRLIDGFSMQEISQKLIAEGVFENDQTVRNTKSKCLKKMIDMLNKVNF
jgi:RNA polymerase sigma factor (sigma-70 family)